MSPRRGRGRRRDRLHGVIVVDKPSGLTSAAVVAEVRERLGAATVGHTGTLDPIATGVLPVCVGAATKLSQWLMADDKAYRAEIELGVDTDTHDRDGAVVRRDPDGAAAVDRAAVDRALAGLVGELAQVPPMHSAIKQGGRRLFELARAGVEVDRAPRPVRVDRIDVVELVPPRLVIDVACSKGTYVRSLVRDLGAALGCGACLMELRRTASGRFRVADAVPLAALDREVAAARLIRPADAVDLPAVVVARAGESDVVHGKPFDPAAARAAVPDGGRFAMVTEAGDLLAVAELAGDRVTFHRVLTYGVAPAGRAEGGRAGGGDGGRGGGGDGGGGA